MAESMTHAEVAYMNVLHTKVVGIIEDYRKKNGDPPGGYD